MRFYSGLESKMPVKCDSEPRECINISMSLVIFLVILCARVRGLSSV